MATKPELKRAIANTKIKASDYNFNFDKLNDYIENGIADNAINNYEADREYPKEQWVLANTSDGKGVYESLVDGNKGNSLLDTTYWKKVLGDYTLGKNQLANCILEAPNGVATYSGSTITLKAGLKVLMPDGLNSDGTLKNIEYTLENDVNVVRGQLKTQIAIFLKSDGVPNDANFYHVVNDYSEITTNLCLYYVINENNIYYRNSQGSISKNICAYIGDATTDGTTITSNIVNLTTQHTINLATKADKTEVDGEWVYPEIVASLVSEMSMNGGTDLELDLTDVLPQDNNIYQCVLSAGCITGSSNGNYINIAVRTSNMPSNRHLNICGCLTRANSAVATVGSTTITIGTNRKLFVRRTTSYNGNLQYMYVIAYRKVR